MSANELNTSGAIIAHGRFDKTTMMKLVSLNPEDIVLCEGRPDFAHTKTTVRQLNQLGFEPRIISDNMPGFLFHRGYVKEVWLSYLSEEDEGLLCPVGALILAVLGKKHGVPVLAYQNDGETDILGEPDSLSTFNGVQTAPAKTRAYVPLVDVVDPKYITKVVS